MVRDRTSTSFDDSDRVRHLIGNIRSLIINNKQATAFTTKKSPITNHQNMNNWRRKKNKLLGIGVALGILLVGTEVPGMAEQFLNPTLAQADRAVQPRMQLILTVDKQVPIEEETGTVAFEWQPLSQSVAVLPGEILRYRLVGKNNGSDSLSSLVLTQPIPPEMVYIIDSAEGASNITFSIDNGETFTANPTVNNVNENGQGIREPAAPESYTHVRWKFERILPPGQELVGTFQVKVRDRKSVV